MILVLLIGVLFVGGILAWLSEGIDKRFPRIVAISALLLNIVILLSLMPDNINADANLLNGTWIVLMEAQWMPRFGISFQLGLDGLSLLMLLLTCFLGIMACGAAWHEIRDRCGFFYFNLLWTLAGVIGVFVALDLFLFFFFWEVMLIPMYFIIAIWGHEKKNYAAMKFFIFTQISGMLMLVAILTMAIFHRLQFGEFSFNYFDLLKVDLPAPTAMLVMLGFFVAFTTKLPSLPFHSWLPDAHSQAPTAGSVILAGVLLKTGAYGLIRFVLPFFPEASATFAPVAMSLAVASIVYCAVVAFAQSDIKRLIAYTSVSHMGFVLLGIYALSEEALQGAVMTMLAHGLSAAALFMLAGGLQAAIHTRDINLMGGFWAKVPRMAVIALFFCIAALGMPGLGNFVGELLVLLGAFQSSIVHTVIAASGLILASVYSLWIIQKIFQGSFQSSPKQDSELTSAQGSSSNSTCDNTKLKDLDRREMLLYIAMILGLVWMGMYPQTFLNLSAPVVENILQLQVQ